ncbi:ABC transporter substrate-binding protein [Paenibacillus sp. TRM 82003]|nr:ABC transporter substrate-binding protein [Paenibacillus sp. TRM 82003]
MKKLALFLMACTLTFSLAACGGGAAETGTETPAASETPATQETPKAEAPAAAEKPAEAAPTGIQTKLDKPVEIEFWHAMTGAHEEALKKITDEFNASNGKGITVKLVAQGGYADLSQKVMASAKAKQMPTMSQMYEDWATDYISNDLLTDLTPYVRDPQYGWTKEEEEDIVKVFRDANTWDGKYYSLPFNKSTRILFYNKGLLEEKGLKVPTNWEELRAAAEAMTFEKDGKKVVGMGFENAIGLEINAYILQAGGEFLDEQSNVVKFNSPEGLEALNYINGFIKDGVGRLAGEDGYMSNPFGRGDVAMYVGSSAGIPFVASAAEGNIEWSATTLPAGKVAATPFQGTNVGVFSSASEEQKLAAWEYIKVLINTENTAEWAVASGYLPVRYSALELDAYKAYVEKVPAQGVGQQQFDAGFYDPRVLGAYAMKNAIAKEIDAVLLGQKTPEQGLADAEKAANDELAKAKK